MPFGCILLPTDGVSVDEYPVGYPKLAAVEAFEKNFLIYKKFGWLHNRVALRLQDELLLLEQDLVVLDEHDAQQDPGRLYSRRRDEALDSKRKALLDEIEEKLHHFDKLILRMNRISKLETPSERNQRSVYNFIHNTGSQVQSESEWVEDRADLVAVVPDQERSVLNAFVEELPKRISRSMTTFLFRTEDQARRIGAENINLYSQKRFDFVANALITFISTLLLLIPIGVLYLARISGILQLVVILCFTQVFGLCIACMTKARKQEVFAVTAAYTAVLVVFLANNNAPSVESS